MYLNQFYEQRKDRERLDGVRNRLEQEQVQMFAKFQAEHQRLREHFESLLRNDLDNGQILA